MDIKWKRVVSVAVLAGFTASVGFRRRRVAEMVVRSIVLALRSPRVINITATAGILTYLCRRFGWEGQRMGTLFGLFFSLVWGIYYRYFVREVPTVKYIRTLWNSMIVEKAQLQKATFSPTVWAYNRHAQTIICLALSSIEFLWDHRIDFEEEKIESFDTENNPKNLQRIHWASMGRVPAEQTESSRPIVVIVPGFGDNRYHPYVQRICRSCLQSGWRAVVFSWWRFDMAEYRDLEAVLKHLQKINKSAPLVAIAYSAGGHILLKYLQAKGKKTPLVAAISCSGCFDLRYTIQNIKENENVSYRLYLNQQAKVCAKRHLNYDKIINKEKFLRLINRHTDCQKLYDEFIYNLPTYTYKPKGGRKSSYKFGEETKMHYEQNAAEGMDKVQITTLVLHAEDDPIVSDGHVDWDIVENNKSIISMKTRRGGHVAWYEGFLPFGETWCDRVCCRFISGVLETHSQTNFLVDVVKRMLRDEQKSRGKSPSEGERVSSMSGFSGPSAIARICSASDIQDLSLLKRSLSGYM
ncbi:hypothetical protein AAMO2058_000094200 [Amorphochlora amoebiformis]